MASRALLLVLTGLLAVSSARAERASPGQAAYVEGLRAFDGGDYATAAARMRVALAEDPREGTARFRDRAQNAEDYFPHLWLGLSLEKLGERAGALEALRESRRQGAVGARAALERILSSAIARLTPPTAVQTAPPPTPAPVVPALQPTALPPLASAPPTEIPARRPAVPARSAPPGAAPTAPAANTAAETTVAPSLPIPPSALRAGLRAFFRGEYAAAESLLTPLARRSARARVFLAWSLGGRYLLEAPRDEALLARARAEYAGALVDGAPITGEPWVSPAILALFGTAAPGS